MRGEDTHCSTGPQSSRRFGHVLRISMRSVSISILVSLTSRTSKQPAFAIFVTADWA